MESKPDTCEIPGKTRHGTGQLSLRREPGSRFGDLW